jgi:hypothetical protein
MIVTTDVRAGQIWRDNERGDVEVLATYRRGRHEWAWLIRRKCNPFTASTDQMLRGDYGWRLLHEAEDAPAVLHDQAEEIASNRIAN